MLSKRAQKLKPSPTLSLVTKAKELEKQGHDVISLTVGEPDWPTFPIASEAGIEAIQKGITKYTSASGTIELRQAIVERTKKDLNLDYLVSEVAVTSGAKFSIFSALQVLCDPGDEVIIPSPYWVSYPAMTELADAVPRIVTCDEKDNFKISAEKLRKNINEKTKVFMLCSPSNPTGFVYTKAELKALAEVLKEFPKIYIISDDIYHRLMFDGSHRADHLLDCEPDLKSRTILINGGSKAYSMTGWRVGWAIGPKLVIQAIADFASQATGAPSSIAQYAAQKVLLGAEENIRETNEKLKSRLLAAQEAFRSIPEFKIFDPQGAFYLWVDVKKVLGRSYRGQMINSSKQLSEVLLEQLYVSTVPGEEFGNPGYIRLSFAIETSRMLEAIVRIKKLTSELS